MNSVTLNDVLTKGYRTVNELDMISSCLSMFERGKPPVLIVLEKKANIRE